MKKFLSLFLAVLMLASMAVSASAAKILKEDGTFTDSTPIHSHDSDLNLFDYFTFYKLPYGGSFNYKGETYYTWWYDSCPECDGLSFHFIKNGAVKFECLEKDCGKNGTVQGTESTDKDEIKYSGKICPDCGGKRTVFIETVSGSIGFLRDQYYCLDCKDDFYTSIDKYWDDCDSYFQCSECKNYAYFDKYYVDGNILFARYECRNGHVTYKKVSSTGINYDKYKVYVYCTDGGDYTVVNGDGAYYGEKKFIKFQPDKGYKLVSVLVDGVSVPVTDNTVEVTVKNNTVVRAYFERYYSSRQYTIETDVNGSGTITAKKNDRRVAADEISAYYNDKVVFTFVPASKNYYVADVEVNGKSVGKVSSYTVSKIQKDIDIEVTFAWKNPYKDVTAAYEAAVEYVTEAGIMAKGAISGNKIYFNGAAKASVRTFIDALAEMADIADVLDNTADRVEWAIDNGLIDRDTDISEICDVQTACDIVRAYLELLEDINDVEFELLKSSDTAKETAIKIDMVTEKIYNKNRDLTRYDLAAICYLIAGLEYDD